MQLITCNIWGGKVFSPLMDFLKIHAVDTDIFCFQEVFDTPSPRTVSNGSRVNLCSEIAQALPDFQGYFAPAQDGVDHSGSVDFPLSFGLAVFIKRSLTVSEYGDEFVFRTRNAMDQGHATIGRNVQFFTVQRNDQTYAILNFHGLWNGGEKTDTEDRLKQSRRLKAILQRFDVPTILCGDFNLLPDTESLALVADGMQNLIKDFHVTSTRSSFYTKSAKFADYIFATPSIQVNKFAVLQDEISDHLPLLVNFQ